MDSNIEIENWQNKFEILIRKHYSQAKNKFNISKFNFIGYFNKIINMKLYQEQLPNKLIEIKKFKQNGKYVNNQEITSKINTKIENVDTNIIKKNKNEELNESTNIPQLLEIKNLEYQFKEPNKKFSVNKDNDKSTSKSIFHKNMTSDIEKNEKFKRKMIKFNSKININNMNVDNFEFYFIKEEKKFDNNHLQNFVTRDLTERNLLIRQFYNRGVSFMNSYVFNLIRENDIRSISEFNKMIDKYKISKYDNIVFDLENFLQNQQSENYKLPQIYIQESKPILKIHFKYFSIHASFRIITNINCNFITAYLLAMSKICQKNYQFDLQEKLDKVTRVQLKINNFEKNNLQTDYQSLIISDIYILHNQEKQEKTLEQYRIIPYIDFQTSFVNDLEQMEINKCVILPQFLFVQYNSFVKTFSFFQCNKRSTEQNNNYICNSNKNILIQETKWNHSENLQSKGIRNTNSKVRRIFRDCDESIINFDIVFHSYIIEARKFQNLSKENYAVLKEKINNHKAKINLKVKVKSLYNKLFGQTKI